MILHPEPSGVLAIAQSAHAFLAFQLAEQWGTRTVRRPALRAELLAAALLHDAGWDGREEPLRLGPGAVPLAFDTWPVAEHEAVWRASVERAALAGRYVALLVSHHVSHLAAMSQGNHESFLSAERARRAELAAELAGDARAAQALASGGDVADAAILRACDALSVLVCRGGAHSAVLPPVPGRRGAVEIRVEPLAEGYRLHPWPLRGDRLVIHAEGRMLEAQSFTDESELRMAWQRAPRRRLRVEMLAPSAPARGVRRD